MPDLPGDTVTRHAALLRLLDAWLPLCEEEVRQLSASVDVDAARRYAQVERLERDEAFRPVLAIVGGRRAEHRILGADGWRLCVSERPTEVCPCGSFRWEWR